MKITRSSIILFLITGIVFLNGCGRKKVAEESQIARPVKTIVIQGAGGLTRTYPGKVQGTQRVNLSFRVSGPLIELPIKEGDTVKKAQLLARIDPRDFDVMREKARAEYEKAEADFKRYLALYEDDAVPLADLDLYRANRDVAKAQLDKASDALNDTYLKAPFDGIIGEKFVENYEYVRAKQDILSMNDVSKVEIVVDMPEGVIASAKEGIDMKLEVSFDAAPGREFPVKVKEVSTQADPETQTYKVTVIMPQPEGVNILPGMTASLRTHISPEDLKEVSGKEMMTIPATAVFPDDAGKSFVWVVDPKDLTVHKREVKVGAITGTAGIQIMGGLSAGERIVVSGVNQLHEGMKVKLDYHLMKKTVGGRDAQ